MKKILERLPQTPGVYVFKNKKREIIYIGKAANLKRRVFGYFQHPPASPRAKRGKHETRIEKMVGEIAEINVQKTDSALEALILEAELIKRHQPPYNILQKDDKTFLYVEITHETFPRVLLVRGKELQAKASRNQFGPFLYAGAIREGLRILRKIFSWNLHPPERVGKEQKPCFDTQVGLCPGVCVGKIPITDYRKSIRKVKLFFQGKKKQIVRELEYEMKTASKNLEFERAANIKHQIFSLRHIQDVAVLGEQKVPNSPPAPTCASPMASARRGLRRAGKFQILNSVKRIEGYDISNISGTSAVGSMVVFNGDEPNKSEYRKFKIYTVKGSDDTGMLREVLTRRLKRREWQLPELMLIDGGRGQVNAVKSVLAEHNLKIPTIGIAKGPERKKNEFIGKIPAWTSEHTLIRVRDEAHRFAITYHKKLRAQTLAPRA